MNSSTTHPLTQAWLRDLELLLHGIEPGERAEVLAGVCEHLDGSLPQSASDDDVRRVLADLGSPQAVADEAYAGCPAQPTRSEPSSWQAITACSINVLGLVLIAFATLWAMGPMEILMYGGLFALPWCATVALSAMAPIWTRRQKAVSALLYPATVAALSTVVAALLATVGPSGFNIVPAVALFALAGWLLARLAKTALR